AAFVNFFDRNPEHLACASLIDLAVAAKDFEAPLFAGKPRHHSGFNSGEVGHNESAPGRRDNGGADELREHIRRIVPKELDSLKATGLKELSRSVQIRHGISRQILDLNETPCPTPGSVGAVKLEQPPDSPVWA